jgi:hypothetical protein
VPMAAGKGAAGAPASADGGEKAAEEKAPAEEEDDAARLRAAPTQRIIVWLLSRETSCSGFQILWEDFARKPVEESAHELRLDLVEFWFVRPPSFKESFPDKGGYVATFLKGTPHFAGCFFPLLTTLFFFFSTETGLSLNGDLGGASLGDWDLDAASRRSWISEGMFAAFQEATKETVWYELDPSGGGEGWRRERKGLLKLVVLLFLTSSHLSVKCCLQRGREG